MTTLNRSRRRGLLLAGAALGVLIFAVSALPTQTKHALHTQGVLHPWLHIISFGLLSFFLVGSLRSDLTRVVCVALLLLFGYATELNEGHRNGWGVEVRDVRSDSAGVLGGAVLALLFSPKVRSE